MLSELVFRCLLTLLTILRYTMRKSSHYTLSHCLAAIGLGLFDTLGLVDKVRCTLYPGEPGSNPQRSSSACTGSTNGIYCARLEMRLINTSSFKILEFNPPKIPRYAILSHTWTDDEFIFSDRNSRDRRDSNGFKKISGCCTLAAAEGWQYLWVDTCCIDKSSSAELTEAINSMYKWYEKSEVCYVYLEDFLLEAEQKYRGGRFPFSRWFSRGWTLQELLAPQNVVFYDREWTEIGSKTFLRAKISSICWISSDHLDRPKEASIATKMSWASRRHTSREEDMAYCLLGLFEINMPLLYGEGDNAFYRLQCEIIQSSADESIFAWKDHRYSDSGLLAKSPSAFVDSNDIVPIYMKPARPPYYMTNNGLAIEFVVRRLEKRRTLRHDYFHASLACARAWDKEKPVMLTLRTANGDTSARENCGLLEFDTEKTSSSRVPERLTFYISSTNRLQRPIAELPIGWLPIAVKLTWSAKADLVSIEDYSEPRRDLLYNESGLIISSHQVEVPKHFALKFTSFKGRVFFLSWFHFAPQVPVCFFDVGRNSHVVHARGDSTAFINVLMQSSVNRIPLASNGNLSSQHDSGRFLWIKTRLEYIKEPEDIEEHPRQVVEVDITNIDRSMFI